MVKRPCQHICILPSRGASDILASLTKAGYFSCKGKRFTSRGRQMRQPFAALYLLRSPNLLQRFNSCVNLMDFSSLQHILSRGRPMV